MREDEVITLGDFAENYMFIIQDEIQGFHWNKQSCTLHPIVMYHNKDKLTEKCLCFISDDLNHDTGFVHEVMKRTVDYIQETICPEVTKVHYLVMAVLGNTRTAKITSTCVLMKRISALTVPGHFLLIVMGNHL